MSLSQKHLVQALNIPDFDPIPVRLPMVPADRALSPPPADHRVGSVLALFYPDDDDLKVILLQRPSNMRNHAGQIAFPGGKQDEGETLEETALRETWEEIGILADQMTVVGRIDPLYIPPSNFFVHCFVGFIDHEPTFVPSEAEVAEIFQVSWEHFLGEANRGRDDIDVGIGRARAQTTGLE
ncbi:MAG: CoA pyrophosphatase [Chloroflexota bacterium]